jgi:hypothetical protein
MKKISLITAFYDIGRKDWKNYNFSRSNEAYLQSFLLYLNYNFEMTIFIDESLYEILKYHIENSKYGYTKKLIKINEEWMKNNIWAWQKLDREREIMNSEEYKKVILPSRLQQESPENTKPEYTILTHSKIDFVNYVIDNNISESDFYIWTDFGYFHNKTSEDYLPHSEIDISKMNKDTVNICCISPIDEKDKDIIYTLQAAPEKIGAYLFGGKKDKLKEFQNLCHYYLDYFQSINIADDEQALWLQCYFNKPELFTLHVFHEWHRGLKYFSK